MDQNVIVLLDQREIRSMKIENGVRQGCCLSMIMFKVCKVCLINEAHKGFGGFKMGHIIPTEMCR